MDRPTAREAIPVEGNPHQGHRRRMLDKFGRLGVDAFADHELLEVLLYYTIRQGDTNPVAHALMQHFGSLHAVLEATADQLCEVEGSVRARPNICRSSARACAAIRPTATGHGTAWSG